MAEDIELYKRRLARELSARKQAETLLEQKSLELYQQLQERNRVEQALGQDRSFLALAQEVGGIGSWVSGLGEDKTLWWSPQTYRIFGIAENTPIDNDTFFNAVHPDDRAAVRRAVERAIATKSAYSIDHRLILLDGRERWVYERGEVVTDTAGDSSRLIGVVQDITDRKRYEERIEYLANYDALTDLPNRNLIRDRLEQAIVHCKRSGRSLALLFLDLDGFKLVNDSYGHAFGDTLLKQVAERLRTQLRDGDTVARHGGDEFIILLNDIARVEHTAVVAEKLLTALVRPFEIDAREIHVSGSMGASVCPADGEDLDTLLKNADAAMYRAKDEGGNALRFYSPEMSAQVLKRVEFEGSLWRALEQDEFELHYQPQVDLMSGRIVGAEALLRWRHPELGLVGPAQFIGFAEETGMIMPIGEWVLKRACAQNKAWQDAGLAPIHMAVNLSAKQCAQRDIDVAVIKALDASGLNPQFLELELTESVSMANPETTVALMQRFKNMGLRLSIDDFGTGYSSMSYLKRFPVDKLKLDISFVREITTDPGSLAISEAIITMAHSLRLKVVAEGVETEGQLALLTARRCDEMQGYYFSRPVPAEQFAQLLRESRCLPPAPNTGSHAARTLLVLDDDRDYLAMLERDLQRYGYRLLLASNATDAFEMLSHHDVGVVLCDQRMPDASGVEFLRKVRSMYPQTLRLMCSGYADFEVAQAAINLGAIHKFIVKSENTAELQALLEEAFQAYRKNLAAN
jgi:diguanylate cyclase (GGDEF)-like protein/PAS domain S-box-containing protein